MTMSPPVPDALEGTPEQDPSAAHALLAANRRRRLARRWIAGGSVPLLLVAALFVGKVISLYAFASQSISAYAAGDYSGSVSAAHGLDPANWFEPYKAPYDQGVGLAESGELAAGEKKFTESLKLAHGLEVCAVRFNLAIVLEREGDAAADRKDHVAAAEFYAKALQVNADRPKECDSPQAQQQSPDPQRDIGQSNKDQQERLKQKQQDQQQQNPDQGRTPPPPPQPQSPDPQKLDDLQKQLQQGEQDRQQNQKNGTDGGSTGTDKPW
ncbi:hypothetical protein [Microbacterium capsulatum]|uniref:Tetratricopeptide repeat protein n=1 Tax=Microbacterium capsulatum TaxID=3041921 RepID=A0ABU0XKW9_9MICO|nr:hypothetical protein [Microbacterium sp. ASV81]MDQ4215787.1 hypothetical protein [Microbacterium sp. ASV81]